MSDLVFKLAIQALSDEGVLPVLGDAVIETGWIDGRAAAFAFFGVHIVRMSSTILEWAASPQAREAWFLTAGAPTAAWGRAIACVALFGSWPTRWVLAEWCCRAPVIRPEHLAEFGAHLRATYDEIGR